MNILKDFLISIGGGAVAITAFMTLFKSIFMKFMEKSIDTTLDKSFEKYKNKLQRSTTAFEILLNRELNFYVELEPFIADLIVLVQDLTDKAKEYLENHNSDDYGKLRKYSLNYLKMIPKLKKIVLIHQVYIPQEIFSASSDVVKNMQVDMDIFLIILKNNNENGEVDFAEKLDKIRESVLKSISKLEILTKARLTELSNVK